MSSLLTHIFHRLREEGGWSRVWVGLATAAVVAGGGLVYTQVAPPPTPPPPTGTANIWVDTDGGSCARSSTPVTYSSASACSSVSNAVQAANPGDRIGWHAGTYSSQTIAQKSSLRNLTPGCDPYGQWGAASTTNCVRVVPDGQITLTGFLQIMASSVWINGSSTGTITNPAARTYQISTQYIDTEAENAGNYPEHVIAEGIDSRLIGTFSAANVNFRDIDAGPADTGSGGGCGVPGTAGSFENGVAYGGGIATPMNNIVWERIYIHDQQRNATGVANDCHWGGLFLKGTAGFTLRESFMANNIAYNIQHQSVGFPSQPTNVTYENNWFGCVVDELSDAPPSGPQCNGFPLLTFAAAGTFTNYLFRFNSSGIGSFTQCSAGPCSYSNVRFVGNVGERPTSSGTQPCGASGVTFGYNVWVGGACGGTDTTASSVGSLFVNVTNGSEDLHLLNTSNAANNFVANSTGDYSLSTDIDGQARPIGANRDAGSDER